MKRQHWSDRPRTLGAQIDRMRHRRPQFELMAQRSDGVIWRGPLRPLQCVYVIDILWQPQTADRPYVFLVDPPLAPREGATFDDIPHLIYNPDNPADSALCLFDPAEGEWNNMMLIADTTVAWASRWLYFYELWHFDGIWRGGGVGPDTRRQARAAAVHRPAGGDARDEA